MPRKLIKWISKENCACGTAWTGQKDMPCVQKAMGYDSEKRGITKPMNIEVYEDDNYMILLSTNCLTRWNLK
jgi:hypothetical protein